MANVPQPLKCRDRITAVGLAALVMVTGGLRMAPGVCGVYHDDAIYVSTAQALAAGEGYRLTGVPGAPLQTKYPILYPTALAAVCYFCPHFPDHLVVLQILTLLSGAGVVGFAYLYLVRFGYCSRGVAASAGLLCATLSYFLYFCTQTMAEMPFALLAIAALWALDGQLLSPSASRRAQFGLGALLALPFLCRTIGATFIVAGVIVLWQARRPVTWSLLGAAAAVLPWVLWSWLGRGVWDRSPIEGYYTDYMGCWSSTGVSLLGRVLCWNAFLTAFGSGDLTLEGLSEAVEPFLSPAPRLLILMGVGLIPWLMMTPQLRQGRPLPWALAVYLLVMLVWSWPPARFLVPILPFLTAYLLAGPAALLRRLPPGGGRRLAFGVGLGVLLLANLGLLLRHARETSRSGYPLARATDTPVAWAAYERTFAWVRRHSEPGDVVAGGFDSMAFLYTGRQAFRPFAYNPGRLFYGPEAPVLMTAEELAAILRHHRPRYLIQTPIPGFAEDKLFAEVLAEFRRQHPAWLVPAYEDEDPRFVVYELNIRDE